MISKCVKIYDLGGCFQKEEVLLPNYRSRSKNLCKLQYKLCLKGLLNPSCFCIVWKREILLLTRFCSFPTKKNSIVVFWKFEWFYFLQRMASSFSEFQSTWMLCVGNMLSKFGITQRLISSNHNCLRLGRDATRGHVCQL